MGNLLALLPEGPYAVYEPVGQALFAQLQGIDLHVHLAEFEAGRVGGDVGMAKGRGFEVLEGVAVFRLKGLMSKDGAPSLGGTSTVGLRRQVRLALADEDVKAGVLVVDSPGGDVAGTPDLANDVRSFANVKPFFAYIEDMGASAAYWVASQCNAIYANANAYVGSIGVYGVVYDQSARANRLGVKAHIVRSGEHKGVGEVGVPITQAQLDVKQAHVDMLSQQFVTAVNRGRGLSLRVGVSPADGRALIGAQARDAGLVDGITSLDRVLGRLKTS